MHRLKSLNHLVQHNKQYHMKVLLNSFHLNGHTLGFHLQTYMYNWLLSQGKLHRIARN